MLEIFIPVLLYLKEFSVSIDFKLKKEDLSPFQEFFSKEDWDKTETKLLIRHTISEIRAGFFSGDFKKVNEAMQILEKYTDFPEAKANLMYFQAILESRNHNHLMAMNLLQSALQIDPALDSAWNLLGYLFSLMGNQEEAIKSFLKAIELEPFSPTYHYNLAYSYWLNQQMDKALQSIDRCIELRDNIGESYYLKGMILQNQNKEEALKNFQIALERNLDTDVFLYHFLNLAYEVKNIKYLEVLMEKTKNSQNIDILKMRLLIHLTFGEYNKAYSNFVSILNYGLMETFLDSQQEIDKELVKKIHVFQCTHKKNIIQLIHKQKNLSEKSIDFLRKIASEKCNRTLFSRDPIVNPVR